MTTCAIIYTEREWSFGNNTVDKHFEHKNLRVLKNCMGSFSSSVKDNIDKTRKKARMIFHLILIVAKLTLSYRSSFGAKPVCPP